MASFTERMIGAAKLERAIYEEVENDPSAMGQAIGVVVLSAVATGIGSLGGGISGMIALGCFTGAVIFALVMGGLSS